MNANLLITDLTRLIGSNDSDSAMLISLTIQHWLGDGGDLAVLVNELHSNNYTANIRDSTLLLTVENAVVRIPLTLGTLTHEAHFARPIRH